MILKRLAASLEPVLSKWHTGLPHCRNRGRKGCLSSSFVLMLQVMFPSDWMGLVSRLRGMEARARFGASTVLSQAPASFSPSGWSCLIGRSSSRSYGTVTAGGGGYGKPQVERAVALCCASQHASQLVYTKSVDIAAVKPTPIGINCRLCHRADCLARAEPPIGRSLLSDDIRRPVTPFGLADP